MTDMDGGFQWPSRLQIIDATAESGGLEPLFPFAFDEVYCGEMSGGAAPAVHIWQHPRAFVLGLRDRRLPCALQAMQRLERQGYAVAVRSSGGAAVPLDSGVVNISLLLPAEPGQIEIHRDFETMRRLISDVLAERGGGAATKGEIRGSYCPGEFDLSMRGMKFCGIAQRRKLRAFAVQAFVAVAGPGRQRAETALAFYRVAAAGADPSQFPSVRPEVMASLSELQQEQGWTAAGFIDALKRSLARRTDAVVRRGYPPMWKEAVGAVVRQMKERYDRG